MKIKKSSFVILCLFLLLFEIFAVPVKFYNYASYIVALLLSIYIIQIKGCFDKVGYVFFFPLAIILSTLVNYGYGSRILFLAAIYGLIIVETFYLISNYIKKESYNKLVNLLRLFALIVMVLNDILCFFGVKFYNTYYLIGSKFRVAYLHCLVIALSYYRFKGYKKIKLSILAVYSIVVAQIVDCSTGVVAILAIWIMLMLKNVLVDKLSGVKFIAVLWGVILVIYVSLNTVLQIPSIQYFVTTILGEDGTLTGRTKIYSYLTGIILNKPIWGYGYQNIIVEKVVGYGNAQNGTIKFLIDYGAIGLGAFAILVLATFYKLGKTSLSNKDKAYPFVVLVTVLFICSIVEVSFNSYMYIALAIIAGLSTSATREDGDD